MNNLYWIDKCITGTIEFCNSTDIFEIYDTLNIKIVRLDNNNIILKGFEALYYRNYYDGEIVFIRDDLPYKYEKFVLAHELGHALLHTEIYTAAFNKNLLNRGRLEKEANYFSLRLLNIKIDRIVFEGCTIDQIAKGLFISEDSISYIGKGE